MGYSDDDDDWNEGHPVPATVIGCVALVGAAYFLLPMLPSYPRLYVLGGAFLAALLVWLIGYVVTIRHASGNGKLLTFLLMVGAALGSSYYMSQFLSEQRIKADLRTLADVDMGDNGYPTFPAGAENRGPISKIYVTFIREVVDGQRALDAAVQKSGLPLLSDASALRANPALLSNCGKIADIKAQALAMVERRRTLFRDLVKAIDATDYPDEFKQGIHSSLAADQTDKNLVHMGELQNTVLDAAQGGCTVLARRHWVAQGPVFMFNSPADLNSFSAFGQRQNQASAELERLRADAIMRMRSSQMSIRRAIGAMPR